MKAFTRLLNLCVTLLMSCASALWAQNQNDVLTAHFDAGWRTDHGTHISGLKIDLAAGWKTYWRVPGEAGIPAQFDWSGSHNLKSAQVIWPHPQVFHLQGLQSIGYYGGVMLPFEFTPLDPSQPIEIIGRIDLGICKDICMPALLNLNEMLPATLKQTQNPVLVAAISAQPKSIPAASLSKISCNFTPITGGLEVTARLVLPDMGVIEALTIEPRQSAWVSDAYLTHTGGLLTATTQIFPLHTPFFLDRSTLRLTAITKSQALEVIGCPAP